MYNRTAGGFISAKMLDSLKTAVSALLFPVQCRVCGHLAENPSDGAVCGECWAKARIFNDTQTLCAKCGAYLRDSPTAGETFCRKCDSLHFDLARAVGPYEGAIAATILKLKRTPHLSETAGQHLINAVNLWGMGEATVLIPVPLSKQRQKERGYNQAAVICRYLAAGTGLKLDERSLVRKIHTPIHRAGMDRKARELSVMNSFEVARPRLIAGESVLLIDDIFTTGATASNCARILKKHGARAVRVVTLGRAI